MYLHIGMMTRSQVLNTSMDSFGHAVVPPDHSTSWKLPEKTGLYHTRAHINI